jgi:WD40 repeat protein
MGFFSAAILRRLAASPADPMRARIAHELRYSSPFLSGRFDPTGEFYFAGAQDNSIQRWHLDGPSRVALVGHRSWVKSFAFLRGQRKMLSGDYAGQVLVWSADAEAPTPQRTLDAHRGWVRAIAVSPDGERFATCGNDNLVKVWASRDFSLVRELAGHTSHVYNLAFHPGGRFLVSGDLRGNLKQWSLDTWQETRAFDATLLHRYDPTFRADHGGIRSMAFNADGSLLACAGITDVTNAFAGVGKPAVVLFNWQTGQRQQVLRAVASYQGTAWGVDFHPSGFIVAAGGGAGGALWFWRPDQPQPFHTVTFPGNARDLALHPEGRRLAVPCSDNLVRLYEI